MVYICEFDDFGNKRNDDELLVEWLEADGSTACRIKYMPERTCKDCAVPDKDYGHAPHPCMFCIRNKNNRNDMYEPKIAK